MHPIALSLGSFDIRWYGVMVAVGFVVGLWLAGRRGLRYGIPQEQIADLGIWLIVGAIIGARAFYVITYWHEDFAGKGLREMFAFRQGGLVFYGGFVGAVTAGVAFVRWKKLPFWKLADALAPSVALGNAFGRIGCLLNGCCYGRVCHLPWALRFPAHSFAADQHVNQGLTEVNAASAPVHPTQIYDALLSIGLYAGLAWLYRRKKFDGQVFAAFMLGYAVLRAAVEILRGDEDAGRYLGLFTPGQLTSFAIFAAAVIFLWRLSCRQGKRV